MWSIKFNLVFIGEDGFSVSSTKCTSYMLIIYLDVISFNLIIIKQFFIAVSI